MSDDFEQIEADPQRGASERARGAPSREPGRARPPDRLTGIASAIGNRGFARTVARMRDGDGILPGGVVHPDVEAAIAAARGSGLALDQTVGARVGAALGDPLTDVRVHTDRAAAALARSVSARAFTVGSDIFFGPGEYRPGTRGGARAAHPRARARGPAARCAARGPLAVSQPGDALEREADDVARDVA